MRAVRAEDLREERLNVAIARVHAANYGVYGAGKVWPALNLEGSPVARCAVERLIEDLGFAGRPAWPPGPHHPAGRLHSAAS